MILRYHVVLDWPPLAWLAKCNTTEEDIEIYIGSRVEKSDDWFCEAVWAGEYVDGGFDLTDIVAGTGCRYRDGNLIFVSSGTTVDRLVSTHIGKDVWVSNSLVCLCASLGINPVISYPEYSADFESIVHGLNGYKKNVITSTCEVKLTYYNNLLWNGAILEEIAKPKSIDGFDDFNAYYNFLAGSMSEISQNLSSMSRKYPYKMMGTLSSGYDSATVATLAKKVGCNEAISFSTGRYGRDDSGSPIATALGINLHLISRYTYKESNLPEVPFMSTDGRGQDVYFTGAEQYLEGTVLFTGFHGDKIWGKNTSNVSDQIVRGDNSGTSQAEYRLWTGYIHAPVPFWGVRNIKDVVKISNSQEMKPWDIQGGYSRPICRRIVEEAGVPRNDFGIAKRAASIALYESEEFLVSSSMENFTKWMKEHRREWIKAGRIPPSMTRVVEKIMYYYYHSLHVASNRISRWAGGKPIPILWRLQRLQKNKRLKELTWLKASLRPKLSRRYLFQWSMERAKKRYRNPFP